MYRNISGVRFTVSFLAILLVVFLSACSSSTVAPSVQPAVQSESAPQADRESKADVEIKTDAKVDVKVAPVKTSPVTSAPAAKKELTGTFSEKATYQSPAGKEDVEFVFVVDKNIVKGLTLAKFSPVSTSKMYQTKFMDGVTSQVVGKKISDIGTFDRVNGSSLTPAAFNRAVLQLKTQS